MSTAWPTISVEHPLHKLHLRLPEILDATAGYASIWGVTLIPLPTTASEPAVEAEAAPVTEPVVEPVAEPATEPAAAPAAEPAAEQTEGAAEPEAKAEDDAAESKSNKSAKSAKSAKSGKSKSSKKSAKAAAAAAAPAADAPAGDFLTRLILQKFLRANSNNVDAAFDQLKDTLVWRKDYFGADGEAAKGWDDTKFAGLGYVSEVPAAEGESSKKIICWNIYGAAKDLKKTFGDLDEFIRWRVALMEASLARLELPAATAHIPDYEAGKSTVDPYQTVQVHDYKDVSFLRLPAEVRTASKKTIEMFARYYPETLDHKYFVNVPAIMGWVYTLMKKVVARETMKKLEMLGSGKELVNHIGSGIPAAYGGSGEALDVSGQTVTSPVKVGGAAAADEAETKQIAEDLIKKEEEARAIETAAKAEAEAKEDAPAAAAAAAATKPETESAKPADSDVIEKVQTEAETGSVPPAPEAEAPATEAEPAAAAAAPFENTAEPVATPELEYEGKGKAPATVVA